MKIRLADTTAISPTERAAEASTLGISPGRWPRQIDLQGRSYLLFEWQKNAEGEIVAGHYLDGLFDLYIHND